MSEGVMMVLNENEVVVNIDKIGWPEIHKFQAELAKGQSINEDAGGFFARCIAALLGKPPKDPVVTYQDAVRAMLEDSPAVVRKP